MAEPFTILLFAIVLLGVAGLGGWLAWQAEKKRRAAFQALAAQHGWAYTLRAGDLSSELHGFRPFGLGHSRAALHLLAGTHAGLAFRAFTHKYTITRGSGRNRRSETHRVAVVTVPMPLAAPGLTIEPETLGKKLFDALGGEDIDFESDAFSRAFWVKCGDRRFAYDVVTPAMMEHLLAGLGGWSWQWHGRTLLLAREGLLRPDETLPTLDAVQGFVQRLPRHLLAGAGPLRAP